MGKFCVFVDESLAVLGLGVWCGLDTLIYTEQHTHNVSGEMKQLGHGHRSGEPMRVPLEVLDSRQRQREKRDWQHQEETDRNAAHAAAMQTQPVIQPVSSLPRKRLERSFGAGMDTPLQTLVAALETGAESVISVLQSWEFAVREAVVSQLEQAPAVFERLLGLGAEVSALIVPF